MGLKTSSALLKHYTAIILSVIIALHASILSYLSVMKHHAFMTTAWDLGIYEQVIWSTATSGKPLWYTVEVIINPSCNFFGIHFAPFLFLVVPVYAIFQTTETLLILQATFISLSAIPLYKLVYHQRGSCKQALIFAAIYLAYPPLHGVALFDFHVQAFLPFLFFFAFYFFKREQWGKFLLFIILSLMVIEFVPLIVMFFGLYGLWVNKKRFFQVTKAFAPKQFLFTKSIFFSMVTIILGFGWFIAAWIIILSINPSAPPHPNWAAFGDPVHSLLGFIYNVLTNPIRTLEILLSAGDQKAFYIIGLFAPLAFLSFLDLPSLMISTPWFFVAFLSNYPPYYSPVGYQYVAFVIPFVFISAICGVKHLVRVKKWMRSCKMCKLVLTKKAIARNFWILRVSFFVAVILLAFFASFTSYSSVFNRIQDIPVVTERHHIMKAFAGFIPPDASILTQNDLFPHVSRRLHAYVAGSFSPNLPTNIEFDYILMDAMSNWYEEPLRDLVYNLTRDGIFQVQYAADGMWLLKRNYVGEVNYPIEKGVFADFYNQGVLVKIFNDISFDSEPIVNTTQLSVSYGLGLNDSYSWATDDPFAARFEGRLYVPISGNYMFRLECVGSSTFTLVNQKILDIENSAFHDMEWLNCVIWLERGFYAFKVEYVHKGFSPPFVRLLWQPPWEVNIAEIQPAFLYSLVSPEISAPFLNLNWDFGFRSPFPLVNMDYFSAFVSCTMYIPMTGIYKFKVSADNYAFISINGEQILGIFNSTSTEFEIHLSKGDHAFEVDFMTLQGTARLSVLWLSPGSREFEEVPSANLRWQETAVHQFEP